MSCDNVTRTQMNASVVSRPEATLFRCGGEARPVAGAGAGQMRSVLRTWGCDALKGLREEARAPRRITTYAGALGVGAIAGGGMPHENLNGLNGPFSPTWFVTY